MNKTFDPPFKNITKDKFQNLLLVGLLTFYVFLIGNVLLNLKMCGNIANDYCAYWSVGKIINNDGFSKIYNLDLLAQYQEKIYPQTINQPFNPVPVPYFPIFVTPFKLLSRIKLPYSYLFWEMFNIIGLFFYLRFFSKNITGKPLPIKTTLLLTLSWQVILDIFYGQVNIVLMIFVGEFIRGILSDKPLKAGLWLGGLLLKPQLLLIILPFLLIQRYFKTILGFITSATSILIVSFALMGLDGLLSLVDLLLRYSRGAPTNSVPIMMNWRMVGWHISTFIDPTLGWIILVLGSLLTIAAPFFVFRRKLITNQTWQIVALLGVFAATCAATWHAHLPMSITMIPFIVYLTMKEKMSSKHFLTWVLLPILAQFVGYLFGILINFDILPINISPTKFIQILGGLSGFILNLGILGWTIQGFTQKNNLSSKGDHDNMTPDSEGEKSLNKL